MQKRETIMRSRKFLLALLAAVLALPLLAGTPVRRVFVTRHGQQPGEESKIKGDVYLTELGREQASLLGKYLKSKNFKGKIYASPYLRTVETAVYAGKEMGLKVYPEPRFQERVGDHRRGKDVPNTPNLKNGGHTLAMLKEIFPDGIADDAKLPDNWLLTEPEDYKTTHSARLMKGLAEVLKEQPEGDVLIVSHAGAVTGFNVGFTKAGCKVGKGSSWNCCLYTYGVDKDGKYSFIDYTIDFIPEDKITGNFAYKNNPEAEKAFKASKNYKDKKSKKSKKSKKTED